MRSISRHHLSFPKVSLVFARHASQAGRSGVEPGLSSDNEHPSGGGRDAQPKRPSDKSKSQHEEGAMSRRLSEMTEQSLHDAGRQAGKLVQEAGFSEELIKKLEERIESANFKKDYASAFAQADITSAAGQGTRDVAGSQPWTGIETQEDAVLRMLHDKHKPLRGARPAVPLPRKAPSPSSGQRLANARDRSSIYSMANEIGMTEAEREQMRKELKDKFTPGARATPASIDGLAKLANERIEEAIARGQFRNLPRGKVIERDYNASSPFIDTTEYLMNKIIQKQEIVPPWIEKQQELTKATSVFRSRLRADWKRHAARSISSRGGSLQDQIRRAEEHASAQRYSTEPRPNADTQSSAYTNIDSTGALSTASGSASNSSDQTPPLTIEASQSPAVPASTPFRDPAWEAAERSYQTLSITNLNNLTRSYNLMAPDLAKKPYFALERELRACYADVAPQLADEIRHRATASASRAAKPGRHQGSLLDWLGTQDKAKVYESKRPHYGFKEFWRDLWGQRKGNKSI